MGVLAFSYVDFTENLFADVLDASFGGLCVTSWAALSTLTRWAGTPGASQALGTPALTCTLYGLNNLGDILPIRYRWNQASTLTDNFPSDYTVNNPTGNTGTGRWEALLGQLGSSVSASSTVGTSAFFGYVGVTNTSGGTLRVNLPSLTPQGGALPAGYQMTIADEGGAAGTYPLHVYPPGGTTISGNSYDTIGSAYGFQTYQWNGSEYVMV
jgi:hypothetical protein